MHTPSIGNTDYLYRFATEKAAAVRNCPPANVFFESSISYLSLPFKNKRRLLFRRHVKK